MFYVPPDTK